MLVLSLVAHRSTADVTSEGLPSWVPKYHRHFNRQLDPIAFDRFPNWLTSKSSLNIDLTTHEPSLQILNLFGATFDSLQTLCTTISPATYGEFWQELGQIESWIATGISSEDTIARTLLADRDWVGKRSTLHGRQGFRILLERAKRQQGTGTVFDLQNPLNIQQSDTEDHLRAARFVRGMGKAFNRTLAQTKSGYLVLAPKASQPSDLVVSVQNAEYPFVLRPLGNQFLLLGECYVDGIMDWQEGYADFKAELDRLPIESFEIQ